VGQFLVNLDSLEHTVALETLIVSVKKTLLLVDDSSRDARAPVRNGVA
jgi:hypothetical protein